jgi:very-short-patch-repair endonuclease
LWNKLKNGQLLGLDFDRQKVIGNYIVDFYSPSVGMVIEIDGESHNIKGEYDEQRDRFLRDLGLVVLHIDDRRVKQDMLNVLQEIEATVGDLGTTPPGKLGTPSEKGNLAQATVNVKNLDETTEVNESLAVSAVDINDYPAVKAHLDKFEPTLSKRQDKGVTPYNLRNCAYLQEFEKEKIVWAGVGGSTFEMTIAPAKMFVREPANLMTSENNLFFIGIFNSKIVNWYYNTLSTEIGLGQRFYVRDFIQIPIPTLNTPEKQQIAQKIESLVEQILEIKGSSLVSENTDNRVLNSPSVGGTDRETALDSPSITDIDKGGALNSPSSKGWQAEPDGVVPCHQSPDIPC